MNNLQFDYWPFVSVDLELTNQCTNACLICPRESIRRPKGFMPQKTFSVISKALISQNSYITFSGMGDPIMHPEVFDFIINIRKNGGSVGIVVNPNTLHPNTSNKLVKARPNLIKVSFPSLRKDIFERLCPQLSFRKGLDITLALIRKAKGKVRVCISGILTKLNLDETKSFLQHWRSEGVSAEMRPCHSRGGNFVKPDIHVPKNIGLKSSCCGLFTFHTFITWQGDVLACCHDLTGETKLGNLITESIDTISKKKEDIYRKGKPFSLCLSCDEALRHLPKPKGSPPKDIDTRKRFFQYLKKHL